MSSATMRMLYLEMAARLHCTVSACNAVSKIAVVKPAGWCRRLPSN